MVSIANEKIIKIVDVLNYTRSLLTDKEPNEIIDELDEVVAFLDKLVIMENLE